MTNYSNCMIKQDIIKDNHFQEFLNSRQVTESTKEQYLLRIFTYCIFLDKTPTELIEEAENDEEQRIRMKSRHIKKYLNDFLHHLMEEQKSTSYIKDFIMTVRSSTVSLRLKFQKFDSNKKMING